MAIRVAMGMVGALLVVEGALGSISFPVNGSWLIDEYSRVGEDL